MRTIKCLVRNYPNKTGAEILEMQKQDEFFDQKEFEKHNKKKIEFIEDINTNGGYYKGRFGLDQYYFYRVFNMRLESSEIYMDVEKIVVFFNDGNDKHLTTRIGEINCERLTKEFQKEDNYSLQNNERVTEKEWNEVNDYLNSITKFWNKLKEQ